MAFIRKLEYDSDKESVICYSANALYNHKTCKKIFTKLYPKSEYVSYRKGCYSSSNTSCNQYWADQDIFILDEKHIEAINALGLDCFTTCAFAIIKKEAVFYISKNANSGLSYNSERYVIHKLIENNTITHQQFLDMCRSGQSEFYRNKTVNYVKTCEDDYSSECEM